MAFADTKTQQIVEPPPSAPAGSETSRTKSVATRLTEVELGEIEAAASKAGKKVSKWLRDAALTSARSPEQEPTDAVLLAEIIGMRGLMLNLFAQASKGPLSTEDMRKITAYAASIKEQNAGQILSLKAVANHQQIRGERHYAMAGSSRRDAVVHLG